MAPPSVRGAVELLRGVVAVRTGHLDQGMDAYRRALGWLDETGDECSIARALVCRGVVHSWQGNLARSLADFADAERIAVARDLPVLVAMSAHNTGVAYCRRGNLPEALAAFDRAQRAYEDLHNPGRLVAVLEADRSEALMVAGLVAEARESAAAAVAALEPLGDLLHLVEARMLLARALLAGGAYEEASCEAARAAAGVGRPPRPLAAQARYVEVQAEVVAVQDRGIALARPAPPQPAHRRRAGEPGLAGGGAPRAHVRRPDRAGAWASRTWPGPSWPTPSAARSRGTADLRARAWHATALLRLAEGDRAGAKRALARGIAVVDEYRATLGATELRAHASGHGIDLARLGVRLALEDGRSAEVLRWAERGRAAALRRPAVHPPDDEQLATDLAELRRVRTEAREAAIQGDDGPPVRCRPGRRRWRSRSATAPGARPTPGAGTPGWPTPAGSTWPRSGPRSGTGCWWSTSPSTACSTPSPSAGCGPGSTGSGRRPRSTRSGGTCCSPSAGCCGPGRGRRPSRRWRRPRPVSTTSCSGPLRLPAGVPLVVVPTGELHGLPWSALPSLAGRPTTVAPSTALWLGGDPGRAWSGRGARRGGRPGAGGAGGRSPTAGRRRRGGGAVRPLSRTPPCSPAPRPRPSG